MLIKDYREDEDPTKFLSEKTGRGQLKPNWRDTTKPIMCAYKLCTVEFKWFGLQGRVEKFIQTVCLITRYFKLICYNANNSNILKSERRLFTKFHRQLFCWLDGWYGLTMVDIRRIEDEVQQDLAKVI